MCRFFTVCTWPEHLHIHPLDLLSTIRSILSLHHLHERMPCKGSDAALKNATSFSSVQIDPSSSGSDSALSIQDVQRSSCIVQLKDAIHEGAVTCPAISSPTRVVQTRYIVVPFTSTSSSYFRNQAHLLYLNFFKLATSPFIIFSKNAAATQ